MNNNLTNYYILIILLLSLIFQNSCDLFKNNIEDLVYKHDAIVHGKSITEWSQKWWQWAFVIPDDFNPVMDLTGDKCTFFQGKKVWFLAGSFSSEPVIRKCIVPTGVSLFFPIINHRSRCNTYTKREYSDIFFEIDGNKLSNIRQYRYETPKCFDTFGDSRISSSMLGPLRSDGYWLMLKPLSEGKHTLHFGGKTGPFSQDITYNITVKQLDGETFFHNDDMGNIFLSKDREIRKLIGKNALALKLNMSTAKIKAWFQNVKPIDVSGSNTLFRFTPLELDSIYNSDRFFGYTPIRCDSIFLKKISPNIKNRPFIMGYDQTGSPAFSIRENWINIYSSNTSYFNTPLFTETFTVDSNLKGGLLGQSGILYINNELRKFTTLEVHYSSEPEPTHVVYKAISTYDLYYGIKIAEYVIHGNRKDDYYLLWPRQDGRMFVPNRGMYGPGGFGRFVPESKF